MTAILLRLAVYGIIAAMIYFGVRSIVRDWRDKFRSMDEATRERDLKERQRPDVIDLSPDEDGVFRPKGGDKKND